MKGSSMIFSFLPAQFKWCLISKKIISDNVWTNLVFYVVIIFLILLFLNQTYCSFFLGTVMKI
jgi:hypothetical protein